MKAIDRVMAAYRKTRSLTEEQAALVRKELSIFIDELLIDGLPELAKEQTGQPSKSN